MRSSFDASGLPAAYMAGVDLKKNIRRSHAFNYSEDGEDIFRIASMTKAITTVAALQLVERELVSLDQPLDDVLPELGATKIMNPDCSSRATSQPITLRHLLTHTAGFGYGFNSRVYAVCGFGELSTVVTANLPRLFEPGERYHYGRNLGWAGLLVEKLTGMSLEAYLRGHVTGPLGMDSTWFDVPEELHQRIVAYGYVDSQGEFASFHDRVPLGPSDQYGGGALFSSPKDYLVFLSMLLSDGMWNGTRILSEASVRSMFENQLPAGVTQAFESVEPALVQESDFSGPRDLFSFGFGLRVDEKGEPTARAYWAGVYNSYYTVDHENKIAVVYFSQFLPFGDPRALDLYRRFERTFYEP